MEEKMFHVKHFVWGKKVGKFRQTEGRGCGIRCVTGLSGSKVSCLRAQMRT